MIVLRILLFLVIFAGMLLFFVMRNQEKGQKPVWQTGSFLRVGDVQMDYREGLVYLDAAKNNYDKYYGEAIWDYVIDSEGNTIASRVKEEVLEQIIYIKVVCRQASELGIVLSAEELQEVDNQTDEFMEKIAGSSLIEEGINADIVRRIYSDNMLARKTFEAYALNVDTDISDEEARQRHFYSVAVRNFTLDAAGNPVYYTGEDKAALETRMQQLLTKATEQTDFYTWAKSVTEDEKTLELTGGEGDFSEEYENVLMNLRTGEMSGVVETKDYYYIFYCKSDFDIDATLAEKERLIYRRQTEEFWKLYDVWRANCMVEVNQDVWGSMKIE